MQCSVVPAPILAKAWTCPGGAVPGAMQTTPGADKAVRLDLQITAMIENGAFQTVPLNPVATVAGPYSQSGRLVHVRAQSSAVCVRHRPSSSMMDETRHSAST